MRKITISATAVAGIATAGLLAIPIASSFADDDVEIKRDEDTPALDTVVGDDDRDDNDRTRDGASANDANGVTITRGQGETNGGPDASTPEATNVTQDATNRGATNTAVRGDDASNDGVSNDGTSGDDASSDDASNSSD